MTPEETGAAAPRGADGWWPVGVAQRRLARWVALLLVAVVAALWVVVAGLGSLPGDAQTAEEVREEPAGAIVMSLAHGLDWLGRLPVAAVVAVLIAIVAWRAVGARYGALAVACLGANAVTAIIKVIVQRPRPAAGRYLDYSFPSGHTTLAAAVLGFATLLALRQRRYSAAAACAMIVAAMGPSRVLLGVHWLSDVVAGYAIGFAWLIFALLIGLPWARNGRMVKLRPNEQEATSAQRAARQRGKSRPV